MANDKNLQIVANQLAELYVEVRRMTNPNYRMRVSTADSGVFLKAAAMCVEKNLSPEDFVSQQYENRPPHTEFYPNMLLNRYTELQGTSTVLKRIQDYSPALIYNVQERYLKAQVITMKRSLLETLMDDGIDFLPWFRVLITDEPIPQVVQKYRAAAQASLFPELVAFLVKKGFDMTRIST